MADIVDAILGHLGASRDLVEEVEDRPGHDRRYLLDSTKIREQLGWEPSTTFEDGVAATIDWYAANASWWEPLLGTSPVAEGAWGASG